METVWTVDFESMPIGPRPEHYPPKPTSVAIRRPDGASHFFNWGHPDAVNWESEWSQALAMLWEAWNSGLPLLFHHAKFDLSICYEICGLPELPWQRIHDTMFLAFLVDPYSRTLGLKELAVTWLGMPKDERDAVDEWVLANKNRLPLFPFVNKGKRPTKSSAGAWIGFAPGALVGPYAIGDVDRTWRLFQALYPMVQAAGMQEAYDVERQVMPIFYANERDGLRVDMARLEADIEVYRAAFAYVEDWLRWRLNSGGLNFDADQDVADALERNGIVTEFKRTAPTKAHPNGQRSVAKGNMHPDMFTDQDVAQALGYRNRLKTTLTMFMEPWLAQAQTWGGRISTNWNQVASPDGGTRTGRPSTRNPNFLNISKDFEGKPDGYKHPTHLAGLPPLPLVRRYILPDDGHVLLKRDFSGQELRVFAHGSQGDLLRQYQANPELDVHHYVGENIARLTGQPHWVEDDSRTALKAMNFQGLYGGGVPALSEALRISHAKAKEFKSFHDQALPDRRIFSNTLSTIVRGGGAIRTWGGRLYVRPPFKKQKRTGQISDADYVLINYWTQGSAADITKRAMIELNNHPDYHSRFMLQVYDELNMSSPVDAAPRQMQVLQEVMESIPLRVKMLSDGSVGRNWGEMLKIKDGVSLEDRLIELGVHDV